jgi:CubicO group peptidase (beta-lactamase class C family)
MPSRVLAAVAGLVLMASVVGAQTSASEAPGEGVPAELHVVAAGAAGMDSARVALIDRAVRQAIGAGGFPGAAVVVGRRDAIVWMRGYGTLDWNSTEPVDPRRTLFDLASLTKVVATATAAMILVDQGRLRLDDPVGKYLAEFAHGERSLVTVRDLLTHRSGLPAGWPVSVAVSPAEARRAVLGAPLVSPPAAQARYSDVGPDVLAFVIERVTGESLDRFVRRMVHRPLGMRATMFRPPPSQQARAAATGAPARGQVHDAAARALGGVAGHAGLFSTAADLARFAQMMLDGGARGPVRIASDSAVALFTRRTAGWRALGWDTCAGGGSCGHRLGPTAYGHTGFTGTSLWIDPERELFVIVLTNWVRGRPGGGASPVAVLSDVRGDVADLAALAVTDAGEWRPLPSRLRTDLQIGWRP